MSVPQGRRCKDAGKDIQESAAKATNSFGREALIYYRPAGMAERTPLKVGPYIGHHDRTGMLLLMHRFRFCQRLRDPKIESSGSVDDGGPSEAPRISLARRSFDW